MEKTPLDVHGLTLRQAQKVIISNIEECYKNNINILFINHGFNNGNKIKTWCFNEIKNIKHVINVLPGPNEGITLVEIENNIKIY